MIRCFFVIFKLSYSFFCLFFSFVRNNPYLCNGIAKRFEYDTDGIEHRGCKSRRGGLRVITLNVLVETTNTCVNLLTIYDKKEIQNVSERYINQIIRNL